MFALYRLEEGGDPGQTVAAPQADPQAGEVEKGTAITLTTATAGASIYYTLDGSDPTDTAAAELYSPDNRPVIEAAWGDRVRPHTRFATRKDIHRFDRGKLASLAVPPEGFLLSPIDMEAYTLLGEAAWSQDLVGLFQDGADFPRRGLGVVAWHGGEIVAGASSYAVFDGGIEIEIDTRPDFRQLGLATACGAALVLSCLERGLYPSWDAHTSISLHLAEKLGYVSAGPYLVYLKQ